VEDNGALDTGPAAQVMIVILIVQDIALGVMLGMLPLLDSPPAEIFLAFTNMCGTVVLVIIVATLVAKYILPLYFLIIKQTESAELFLMGLVTVCLIASSSTEHLGLSIETGAFMAGIMINSHPDAPRMVECVEPLRDIFAALFFTCIGVHVDAYYITANLQLILSIVSCVTLMKVVILSMMVKLSGYPFITSLNVGIALAQIGEFAFVLAAHGKSLDIVSKGLHKLLLHLTVVSLILTPFLIKATPWILRFRIFNLHTDEYPNNDPDPDPNPKPYARIQNRSRCSKAIDQSIDRSIGEILELGESEPLRGQNTKAYKPLSTLSCTLSLND